MLIVHLKSIECRVILLFRFAKGLSVIATQAERLFGQVLITSNRLNGMSLQK